MASPKVLVVDDEKLLRWSVAEPLRKEGFEVQEAADGESALELVRRSRVDVILMDVRLPGKSGIEILRILRDEAHQSVVIMMTAFSEVREAVESMKLGAFDYLIKPLEPEAIEVIVKRALEHRKLEREVTWRRRDRKQVTFDDVVAESQVMKRVVSQAKKVAASRSLTVFLAGQTGTGKDFFAQAIHSGSERSAAPFVTINCSALPESLLESELFGYEKGTFTDARTSREGLFELADGGTVYLDEIAEMNPSFQTKLLRLIEDKTFKRLGGRRDIEVDVRIIAATNREVEQAVREAQLREDLYYRLKVVPIELPPLSARKEDISHLTMNFVRQFCEENHRPPIDVSPAAMDALVAYDWPGNVRELRNLLERIVLLEKEDRIDFHHLPMEIRVPGDALRPTQLARSGMTAAAQASGREPPNDSGPSLPDVERQLIIDALKRSAGNQVRAAKLLGISRDTLRYRMKKYRIEKKVLW
ncbi:MAG: sigma-54-dependent Fis family transcriptional regulator [Candidatus Eiseniibacteriota bacterium]|nr:MAG: sigma-54-dependent Fis family transcriptional regulator [Candidatus Eisenbacteria bacterium]